MTLHRRVSLLEQASTIAAAAALRPPPPPVPAYSLLCRVYERLEAAQPQDGFQATRAGQLLRDATDGELLGQAMVETLAWRQHVQYCRDGACAHHAALADPDAAAEARWVADTLLQADTG